MFRIYNFELRVLRLLNIHISYSLLHAKDIHVHCSNVYTCSRCSKQLIKGRASKGNCEGNKRVKCNIFFLNIYPFLLKYWYTYRSIIIELLSYLDLWPFIKGWIRLELSLIIFRTGCSSSPAVSHCVMVQYDDSSLDFLFPVRFLRYRSSLDDVW